MLRYLDPARQAVDRAAGLTRRLLAFARRQRLEPKLVDPDALVAGMADMVRRTVGPAVRLDLHLRDGRARVLCDPNELESALLNLCINARDAMPEGGRLTIGTEDVRLSAADVIRAGRGCAGRLCGNFSRGHRPGHAGRCDGTSLRAVLHHEADRPGNRAGIEPGLWLRAAIRRHRAARERPGKGTTVRLLLPQHAEAAVAESTSAARTPVEAGSGQAVLLVDDEEAAREAMAERLRDLGYRVLEAADGPAALHLLDGGARVDMLVTDVGLPNGMNGRQVAEAVRERRPGIPSLFITGYAGTAASAWERSDRQALRPRHPGSAGPGGFDKALKIDNDDVAWVCWAHLVPCYRARRLTAPRANVGGVAFRNVALNCRPWVRSLTQVPLICTHSPAETLAAWPTMVISSRWPRALRRSTQKLLSSV